jgi:hypothetical protein
LEEPTVRLLIVGCEGEGEAINLLRRLRIARSLRPLHLCFWDPDIETARALMNSVGAGLCLREVTAALLVHVDVVLMFADDGRLREVVERAIELVRKPLRPVIVSARGSYVGGATAEQKIVSGILFRAMDDAAGASRSDRSELPIAGASASVGRTAEALLSGGPPRRIHGRRSSE